MRSINSLAIILFSIIANNCFSQETNAYSGFGGPMFRLSSIEGDLTPAVGGIGGVVYKSMIAYGGFGLGYTSEAKTKQGDLIDIGGGGLYFAYIINDHLQVPILLEWNDLDITSNDFSINLHSVSLLPGVEYNYPVKDYLRICVRATYRKSFIDENDYFNEVDFDGLSISLGIKFGVL